jgi:hypothetical protein
LGREKLRSAINDIYVAHNKKKHVQRGHVYGKVAHDHLAEMEDAEFTEDGPSINRPEFADDPELKELHEELHHLDTSDWEEKRRIDTRLKNRMHELQHRGQMHADHMRGHLHAAMNLTKHHEEKHGHDPAREAEPHPDRSAKPIIEI